MNSGIRNAARLPGCSCFKSGASHGLQACVGVAVQLLVASTKMFWTCSERSTTGHGRSPAQAGLVPGPAFRNNQEHVKVCRCAVFLTTCSRLAIDERGPGSSLSDLRAPTRLQRCALLSFEGLVITDLPQGNVLGPNAVAWNHTLCAPIRACRASPGDRLP